MDIALEQENSYYKTGLVDKLADVMLHEIMCCCSCCATNNAGR